MLRISAAVIVALVTVACSPDSLDSNRMGGADGMAADETYATAMPPMPAPPPALEFSKSLSVVGEQGPADLNSPRIVQPDPNGGGGGAPPGTAPLMAYTYGWEFAVQTDQMQSLLNAHKKLCEDAGPAKCYVTNSRLYAIGQEEGANGFLSMRATEVWVREFERGVNDGLKPFNASIFSNSRGAEELTAQIVDHEARLKSMIAHRDSLQRMLDNKPGRLSDLLEIEQSLAQAQGDIDSYQSTLAALKLRVAMSELTFQYRPEYAAQSESVWRPLGEAFGKFLPSVATALAQIVAFFALILPWVVIIGLAVWVIALILGWRARSRDKKAANPAPPAKPAGS